MSGRQGRFKCPKCGTILTAWHGAPDVECDCWKICELGTGSDYNTSGCSTTEHNYSGDLNDLVHVNQNPTNRYFDVLHITGYCSAHDRYIHKPKIVVDIDWEEFFENPPSYASRYKKR